MKSMMKKTLATLTLTALMAGAHAQDPMTSGQASMEVSQKIMEEVMSKLDQSKMADPEYLVGQMIDGMKAHLPELKEAGKTDCVALYGEAKADACSCVSDKTDYDEIFAMMKKQASNPQLDNAEIEKMAKKGEELSLSCGFTAEDIATAQKEAQKMLQQAAPAQ